MASLSADQYYGLWVLLAQTREAMLKARQKELAPYRLSPRQCAVLFYLQATDGQATPAEISRGLFRESHSISEILSRMEKQELVRKVKDLSRKNMVRVELTEKGHEAFDRSTRRESIYNILSSLSDEEHQQLGNYLKRLRDKALQLIGKNMPLFP